MFVCVCMYVKACMADASTEILGGDQVELELITFGLLGDCSNNCTITPMRSPQYDIKLPGLEDIVQFKYLTGT